MFKTSNIKGYLTLSVLIFILLLLVSLFYFDIPRENKDLVNILLGAVIGWVGSIISYYFGASTDNQYEKTVVKPTQSNTIKPVKEDKNKDKTE